MTDEISCINEHITKMRETVFHSHHATNITTPRTGRHVLLGAEPELGATLPASLVIPVTLDCFVDGFLIGVTSGLSPHAGIVLGIANCLEMGFLGMAYSLRLKKCTGSGWALQQIALFGPPGLMFLSSGLGAYISYEARDSPAVFVGFVAFGTVALLSLVCTELLIEAKEAQGEQQVWYAQSALYAAVYLVLMLSRVT
jgi:zinc transporter ZupT